jgi:hypothetical protein
VQQYLACPEQTEEYRKGQLALRQPRHRDHQKRGQRQGDDWGGKGAAANDVASSSKSHYGACEDQGTEQAQRSVMLHVPLLSLTKRRFSVSSR